MNPEQVREIAEKVYFKHDTVSSALLRIVPKVNTREACELLECSRKWLYQNRHKFGSRIKNKRGDYEFDTSKIVAHKRSMISE